MISIIVPIYKVEAYLKRCLDSLLNQEYQDFELVLVDDGSPDQCGEMCDEFAEKDSRIRVIHKENGGLSDARNAGLAVASGDYVTFVDSDDWVAPGYLGKMYAALMQEGADICECIAVSTDSEVMIENLGSGARTSFTTEEGLKVLILDTELHQHVWNKLYKREMIEGILFEKGKTNEDEFWTYRVFGRAQKIVKLDIILYYYFQRPGSIMGESYSLKRLDVLDAKVERQRYMEKYFPVLFDIAGLNLYWSCIYAGQMSLKYLDKVDFKVAKKKIDKIVKIVKDLPNLKDIIKLEPVKSRLWPTLARISFWNAVWLRSLLKKGR